MTRSKRIHSVVRIARNKEHDAAVVFGESQTRLQQEQQRLQELISYREEYSGRVNAPGGEGLSGARMNEHRMFLNRLNTAIDQQNELIRKLENVLENDRAEWLSKHQRTQALGKVEDRYRREEHQHREKQEQKESDDFSGRKGSSRD